MWSPRLLLFHPPRPSGKCPQTYCVPIPLHATTTQPRPLIHQQPQNAHTQSLVMTAPEIACQMLTVMGFVMSSKGWAVTTTLPATSNLTPAEVKSASKSKLLPSIPENQVWRDLLVMLHIMSTSFARTATTSSRASAVTMSSRPTRREMSHSFNPSSEEHSAKTCKPVSSASCRWKSSIAS